MTEYSLGYAFQVRPTWRDLVRMLLGASLRVDLHLFTMQKPPASVRAQTAFCLVDFPVPAAPGLPREPRFTKLVPGAALQAWRTTPNDLEHLNATVVASLPAEAAHA